MANKPGAESNAELEERVWSAISAFEQILEAMPNDRESLDTLAHAYAQVGDHTRAKDYMVRLCSVIVDQGDADGAKEVLETIKIYAENDDKAKEVLARMEAFLSEKTAGAAPRLDSQAKTPRSAGMETRATFNMADELSFAWNLLEAGELTQEEYASIVQDLTEMSAGESNATISVLHVLEARAFKSLERILGFVSRECGTPVILPSCFDIQPAVFNLLPLEFVVRKGILVFELLGKDALVVAMNPYNKALRQEVEQAIGRKCHFFVSLSSEFDHVLVKMNQATTEKEKK